ncbi:MAG: ATP synthase F1 subunit delta [Candidatus Cloacimonetes bacterium]|nr:ATP synthase F1 subunit delta [Candidatus Cloacimonadota bacterium]
MKDLIIAKRYAIAALGCLKKEEYEDASQEAFALWKFFTANPDVLKYMAAPVVSKDNKLKVYTSIIQGFKLKEFWSKIFKTLVVKHRCGVLTHFLKTLDILLIEALDKLHIDLILAHEQDKDLVRQIDKKLEEILGRKVTSDVTIDKDIIGGFIGITENKIIDASVKSQLTKFMKRSETRN